MLGREGQGPSPRGGSSALSPQLSQEQPRWEGTPTICRGTHHLEQHPVPGGSTVFHEHRVLSPHGEVPPAGPFPRGVTAGITGCRVKTALPQPKAHKKQTRNLQQRISPHGPGSPGAAALRDGLIRSPGGTAGVVWSQTPPINVSPCPCQPIKLCVLVTSDWGAGGGETGHDSREALKIQTPPNFWGRG